MKAWFLRRPWMVVLLVVSIPACFQSMEAREAAPPSGPAMVAPSVSSGDRLVQQGLALLQPVTAGMEQFELVIRADVVPPAAVLEPRVEDGLASKARRIQVSIARTGSESWRLFLLSPWKNAAILHCATQTQLVVPQASVVFEGTGPLETGADSLVPQGFLARLITPETAVFPFLSILAPATIEGGLRTFVLPYLTFVSTASSTSTGALPAFASGSALSNVAFPDLESSVNASGETSANVSMPASALSPDSSIASTAAPSPVSASSTDMSSLSLVASLPARSRPFSPASWSASAAGASSNESLEWKTTKGITVVTGAQGPAWVRVEVPKGMRGLDDFRFLDVRRHDIPEPLPELFRLPESARKQVARAELEKLVFRGLKRILSLKLPGPELMTPLEPRRVANGELARLGDQAVVLIWGTTAEIFEAHAQLLGPLYRRTVDSTVYLVGLVETIAKGRWFLDDLRDAWKRLNPHIPDDHKAEMTAMARAYPSVSAQEVELSNVFPEYFHCSGFALFGSASRDGVLYHGRVLDYMTEIGLQQSAVNFVVKPRGKRAFLNVGFAGFIGSVSGMNDAQIALGEMGGGGRFQWDGAPMATLMRRALEECETLAQVKNLWASAPRTCEYYYVFSDGKIPDAVAVKATPKELEFLAPGASHPLLGEGFKDAVVLSAGGRLKHLRERVQAGLGAFTAGSAIELMSRPVAMKSNLHNVLFVPQKLEAWVAVAGDGQPAAERTYERIDFPEWLKRIP